ncbi:MAG: T9SS type A sorting domain-containing protein [Candidatus Latescibacteria bacterium]|nr:T9SS type A sorting domain-containing protein [Candidatus Latescibacterota bacterium]
MIAVQTLSRGICALGLILTLAAGVQAQIRFEDASWRLRPTRIGLRTPSWIDINGDGRLDILMGGEGVGALALQTADGDFVLQRAAAGLVASRYTVVAGDYDNDGDADMYTAGFGEPTVLLEAEGGRFSDRTQERGVDLTTRTPDLLRTGVVFVDYDLDGDLDLFVGNERGRDVMFRNDGPVFVEVTAAVGLEQERGVRQVVFADFDNDGDPDLFAAANTRLDIPRALHDIPSALYVNEAGVFTDVGAAAGLAHSPRDHSGTAAFDYDNDGWTDLFFTSNGEDAPLLYRNQGDLTFADVSEAAGLAEWRSMAEATIGDYDNDGWDDIFVVTSRGEVNRDMLFHNSGDGTFAEIGRAAGLDGLRSVQSATASSGDFDRDGYLDIFLATFDGDEVLYRNAGSGNHWLAVELVGTRSNRSAFGARLYARAGDLELWRETRSGNGYHSNSPWVHLGLGAAERVDSLEVRWPSGATTRLADVPADRPIRVVEGTPGFFDAAVIGVVEALPDTVAGGAQARLRTILRPAPFDADSRIVEVSADLSELGGPGQVALVEEGDGTFSLDQRVAVEQRGAHAVVRFDVHQQTALGPRHGALLQDIVVVPTVAFDLFAEVLAPGWQVSTHSSAGVETAQADGLGGSAALALDSDADLSWWVQFRPAVPLPIHGYAALSFVMRIDGESSGTDFRLVLDPLSAGSVSGRWVVRLVDEGLVDPASSAWQRVEIPLPDTQLPIEALQIRLSVTGRVLVDDFKLLPVALRQTAVADRPSATPAAESVSLQPAYPNPFNGAANLTFAVKGSQHVRLEVYNVLGQLVTSLIDGPLGPGTYRVAWDGTDANGHAAVSGLYLARLAAGGTSQTRRLVLVR